MEQEITFGGMTNSPSGHLSKDGDLALSIGLVPHNGELAQIEPSAQLPSLPQGYECVCVHVTPRGERIIAISHDAGADALFWTAQGESELIVDTELSCIEEYSHIRDVKPCGMLLVIATDEGLEYAHWTEAGYAALDLRNPPIVEFGLQKVGGLTLDKRYAVPGWMATEAGQGYGQGAWLTHPATTSRASETDTVTRAVFADFKDAVATQAEGRGYWHSPFFVRYALRLNDGTHILPSPPVLMLPSLMPPMIKASAVGGTGDEAVMTLDASGMSYFALRYRLSSFRPAALGPYVTAIDVFATESVPTYAETPASGSIVSYLSVVKGTSLYGTHNRGRAAQTPIFAGQWSASGDDYADRYVGDDELSMDVWRIAPNASLISSLLSLKDFHLIGSIPVSGAVANGSFTSLAVCDTSASALAAQPGLEADEADTARRIMPSVLWSDGTRMVAAGGQIALPKPWPLAAGTAFCGNALDPSYMPLTVTAYSRSFADDGYASTECVSAISPRYSLADAFPHYLYCADPGVYKIELRQGENAWNLPMRRHPSMPGAYWIGDLECGSLPEPEPLPPLYNLNTVPAMATNALYESQSETPFAFSRRAIVGDGEIRYVAPAFKAMSSGQFGQYPLYIFTSAGIWAMPSSAAGLPVRISDDVARSVAVCGTVVAYATCDGVYTLAGSQSECISADMSGYGDRWLTDCAEVQGLLQAAGLSDACISFGQALGDGKLKGDSKRSVIRLESANARYVYSLADRKWGMESPTGSAFIITRPIKLNSPSSRKRLTSVALTGPLSLKRTNVAVVGSDDLRHWRLLGSAKGTAITAMRGTGARYVAVVACCGLKPGQTISGCIFFY